MGKRRSVLFLILGLALLALAVPGALAETEGVDSAPAVSEAVDLQLGSSSYHITLPGGYVEGEITEEEIEDDMIGYYYSNDSLLDLDIYQFGKDGIPSSLEEYAATEASEYAGTSELVPDGEINGIPAAWYRTVETYDYAEYNTITYILDSGDDFVEIVFWLDGDDAEAEHKAIMQTLSTVEAD